MSLYHVPEEAQSASTPVLFDPEDDVFTTGRPILNNYVRHVQVGSGQHGQVFLCYRVNPRLPIGHPERRIPVAMKSVRRNNPRAEQMKNLRKQRLPPSAHVPVADKLNTTEAKIKKEIAIMKKLRHPHVIRLYEVIDDRMKEKIYMVMEYLGGGEVKWRDDKNRPVLTISQTRRILRDAVLGLEYLHHQGIIHRDIKPANLLWTEDRRQVKIGDFGVSHFSYAQRLAAAGGKGDKYDPDDPLLLDDSSLTRRAGTPSFLAPEIIYEHTIDFPSALASASSIPTVTTTPILNSTDRPEITKSIDIWALGVTFYCLLFGTTPFVADTGTSGPGSEFTLYNAICNTDWPVPPTMGYDKIPTGGRHPDPDCEGAGIIRLLDHFLQKDYKIRITLEQVKHSIDGSQLHPWILNDLDDPQRWLQITSPSAKIDVTVNEASDAMSAVRFRWRWGGKIAKHITSVFRSVRPIYWSSTTSLDEVGSQSEPGIASHSLRSNKDVVSNQVQNKGKSKATESFKPATNNSTTTTTKGPDPKSTSQSSRGGTSVSKCSAINTSDINVLGPEVSPSTSKSGSEKRSRLGLFWNWRPTKPTDNDIIDLSSCPPLPPTQIGSVTGVNPNSRRSEEALRFFRYAEEDGGDDDEGGRLTAARRASSWGQGDKELLEVVSVTSIERELNDHEMNVGAGGVSRNGDHFGIVGGGHQPVAAAAAVGNSSSYPSFDSILGANNSGMVVELEESFNEPVGQPYYDVDSSTLASSGPGDDEDWRHGIEFDEDVDEVYLDEEDDDDADDDEDDEDDEDVVTFSPRRRPIEQTPDE